MIPQRAVDLILKSEGLDQPWSWPGAQSGITLGYGYDLGYEMTFVRDWRGVLPPEQIDSLIAACGRRGQDAAKMASSFRWINITREQARLVFDNRTLPHYEAETAAAFPGVEKLPDLVRGALVSLVYNRGSSMTGARRAEMRAIRTAVRGGDLAEIALQIEAMKHLWIGQGLNGLLVRRDAEAALVTEAMA